MLCAVIHRKTTNKKLELFCLSPCLVSSIFFSVLWYFVQNAEKLEGIEVYDEHYRVDLLNDLTESFCCLTVDPCYTDPCENDGQCFVDDNYDFFCVCPIPKAYEGKNCSKPGKQ